MHLKQYYIHPDRCTRCHRCLAVCPADAIELTETGKAQIRNLKCIRCKACKKVCHQGAISYRVRLQF
ncbi:4Fe-4S dicluster domain-containing protein [Pelosinus fermentans]|uniref:ATP-binding protein n=1 Tax=Pelosinus fermentans TaxID=365349 RepID=UPI000900572A